jgi:hypothetical protein
MADFTSYLTPEEGRSLGHSVVSANLAVNPSLTITALSERAMSFIPLASENHWIDAAADSESN